MTSEEHENLRRLAQAAIKITRLFVRSADPVDAFHQAAHPGAVLALLDDLAAVEEERDKHAFAHDAMACERDALAEAIQRAVMREREAIAVWHDKLAADDAAPTRDTESVNAGVLRRMRSTWHETQAAAIRARGEAGR
jgi:hypothetical protein